MQLERVVPVNVAVEYEHVRRDEAKEQTSSQAVRGEVEG